MQNRSQITVEFMLIFSMAFLVFLVLVLIITQYVDESNTQSEKDRMDAFAESIRKNIMLAKNSGSGYEVKVSIPEKLDGYEYDIFADGDILYVKNIQSGNLVYRIIPNVSGNFQKGCNRIYKDNKGIYIDQNC